MDCNKCTSWDEYSDLSDEEAKQNEDQLIIDAKICLFLRKYTSFPLKVIFIFLIFLLYIQKEELIEVFVQSNFDEEAINLILEKKLIEKQKNRKNLLNEKDDKKELEEEKEKNQSKFDSWKENKENNNRYKKTKYKGHNYNNNYNNNFFYHNKKHFKDYKNYKYNYNQKSDSTNYNINGNQKKNYIEKEIELNSKGETEGDSEIKTTEAIEDNIPEVSLDSNPKNNLDFKSHENTEEISSGDLLNLDLMKSQSEDLSHKYFFDFHDVGIKLFPGAFRFNTLKNYEKNNINLNSNENNNLIEENKKVSELNFDNFKNKNDIECNNYLCKANSGNIKNEQKNGLALALDYYSSFLEDKIIIK